MTSDRRRPFHSDGCTLAPDLWFRACCIEHDRAYWAGGSPKDRAEADRQLRECIASTSGVAVPVAWVYWAAVRAFGSRFWPRTAKPRGLNWAGPEKRASSPPG